MALLTLSVEQCVLIQTTKQYLVGGGNLRWKNKPSIKISQHLPVPSFQLSWVRIGFNTFSWWFLAWAEEYCLLSVCNVLLLTDLG